MRHCYSVFFSLGSSVPFFLWPSEPRLVPCPPAGTSCFVSPVFLEAGAFQMHDVDALRVQRVGFPFTLWTGSSPGPDGCVPFDHTLPDSRRFSIRLASCVKPDDGKLMF